MIDHFRSDDKSIDVPYSGSGMSTMSASMSGGMNSNISNPFMSGGINSMNPNMGMNPAMGTGMNNFGSSMGGRPGTGLSPDKRERLRGFQ